MRSEDPAVGDPVAAIALLDEPNRRRLYQLVAASREPVGRDEAATQLGISRELAAFHLDQLVGGGLLEAEYRRRSGRAGPGAGRPAKLYRRASRELSVSLPSRHYEQAADVLAEGLERLGSRVAATAVGDVARERGRALGLVARRNAGRRPGRRRRLTALIELLDEAGFEPEVDRSGTVRLRNCPYDALAVEHRDLTCGMNVAWGEGVVDALEPGLSAELAPSTGYCCVLFRQTEPGGRSNRARSRPACAAG